MSDNINHTYAVCAYKESPYLEECVKSLLSQTVKSNIYISTSTPNEHISSIAEKYRLPLYINTGVAGITGDWNYAYSMADTKYITIAHQDDVYHPEYTEAVVTRLEKCKTPIIAFTEYFELRQGDKVYKNKLLKIKRFLNIGFRLFKSSRFVRRRILSLGNSICCPAVTFSADGCRDFSFDGSYKFSCDWDAWERLSRRKGAFIYIKKPLMGHRIHEGSATTELTAGGERAEEELRMFRRFWPGWIAKLLAKPYAKGADSNVLEKKDSKK